MMRPIGTLPFSLDSTLRFAFHVEGESLYRCLSRTSIDRVNFKVQHENIEDSTLQVWVERSRALLIIDSTVDRGIY